MDKRSIPLPTGSKVAAFARMEAGAEQLAQAVVLVDPGTGEPCGATEASLAALGLAIGTLNTAAAAIKVAVEALNGKATAINTGAIAGTVALDAFTLMALESISANTGLAQPLTNAKLRAAAVPVSGQFYPATQPVSGAVTNTPATPTPYNLTSAASTNANVVKNSAGTLYSVTVSNTGAATRYLKLYNKASAPTVGTDVPVLTIPVPAAGTVTVPFGALGHRFAAGIALAITAGAADSDTAAVAANEVKALLAYL